MSDKDSKTEQATVKRRMEAFSEGNFPKSAEVDMVFVLASGLMALGFFGGDIVRVVVDMTVGVLGNLGRGELNEENAVAFLLDKFSVMLSALFPVMGLCFIGAVASGVLQTGGKLTPKVVEPKFSKLNPIAGFQRVFSGGSLRRGGMDLLKFMGLMVVVYGCGKRIMQHEIFTSPLSVMEIGKFIYETFYGMMKNLLFILGVIAAGNYFYQRYKVNKDLMMTKEEVKDEAKNMEGNPKVKSAQKALARRLLRRQMLKAVPLADVVLTNPTHYAVALKYEVGKDLAPVVLAKGERMFAKRIKALAAEHGVPMVENKPVARALYKMGKVGKSIPPQLYQVIAEILTMVYRRHKHYFYELKRRRMEEERGGER